MKISNYCTKAVARDNIFTVACAHLSGNDNTAPVLTLKTNWDCNVNAQDARLNCVILYDGAVEKWKRCIVTIDSTMMEQFTPWYFGVAFAFLSTAPACQICLPFRKIQNTVGSTMHLPWNSLYGLKSSLDDVKSRCPKPGTWASACLASYSKVP